MKFDIRVTAAFFEARHITTYCASDKKDNLLDMGICYRKPILVHLEYWAIIW